MPGGDSEATLAAVDSGTRMLHPPMITCSDASGVHIKLQPLATVSAGKTLQLVLAAFAFIVFVKDTMYRVSCTVYFNMFASKLQPWSLSAAIRFTFASRFAAATTYIVTGTHEDRW